MAIKFDRVSPIGPDTTETAIDIAQKNRSADLNRTVTVPNNDKRNTFHASAHKLERPLGELEDAGREISDNELVSLVKKGVRWAADVLVRRYYSKARALVFHMCGKNAGDTEDITQQALLNALGNIETFEEKASFKTWLYRILVNACLDARRRRRRWLGIFPSLRVRRKDGDTVSLSPDDFPDEGNNSDPSASYRTQQLRGDIQKALGTLPEQQRLVFQLKVLQELSIPEIAEIMELAPGTVKSHLFRATRMMREALAEWAGR